MPKPGYSLNVTPAQLREAAGIGDRVIRAALFEAANELRNAWTEILETPGTGNVYPKGIRFVTLMNAFPPRVIAFQDDELGRKAQHTASAPGEPPARDTGASIASITVDDQDLASINLVRVGTNMRHLLALEFGVNVAGSAVAPHPGGIVIEPRPHARPAKDRAVPRMNERVVSVLRTGRR